MNPFGGLYGVLEILLPGLFLFLNLSLCVYWWTDKTGKELIEYFAGHTGQDIIVAVPVGYCFGIALRLLRTRKADRWSGRVLRRFDPGFALKGDEFPYAELIKKRTIAYLHPDVKKFYDTVWTPGKHIQPNHVSFDFFKTVLTSIDPKSAANFLTAEALVRYVANTFYALLLSLMLLALVLAEQLLFTRHFPPILIALMAAYLVAIFLILRNFRYLRLYEVEKVFNLAFHHRQHFLAGCPLAPTTGSAATSPDEDRD